MQAIGKNTKDLSGQRFERLRVTGLSHYYRKPSGDRVPYWQVICDCGASLSIRSSSLTTQGTKSCGCLQKEAAKRNGDAAHAALRRHGLSTVGSRAYQVWSGMIQRCTNAASDAFIYYGGKGVRVCDRWRKSFEAFYADMGDPPAGLSIDRWPNNAGDYEPGNCRWATPTEQIRNRSNTKLLAVDGETRPLAEWAEITGIPSTVIWNRVRRNWPHDRIFLPKQPKFGHKE